MTIGSLFSGIGGLELGLERAGPSPVKWQVEIDPFCRQVLEMHWPDSRRYEDVTQVGPELEPVDIICGGFPCQDISLAGKGAGLTGERSGLWSEYLRIVRLVRPRVVVVENVAALLSRGLGDVLGDLATSGYDAIWDCIPAAAIGAPQRRDRLFVVAWRVSNPSSNGIRQQPERDQGGPAERGNPFAAHLGAYLADCDVRGRERERVGGILNKERATQRNDVDRCSCEELANSIQHRLEGEQQAWTAKGPTRGCHTWPPSPDDMHAWGQVQADSQPSVCRESYGLPRRVDRLRSLGNAVVPQVAEVVGRVVREVMESMQ